MRVYTAAIWTFPFFFSVRKRNSRKKQLFLGKKTKFKKKTIVFFLNFVFLPKNNCFFLEFRFLTEKKKGNVQIAAVYTRMHMYVGGDAADEQSRQGRIECVL